MFRPSLPGHFPALDDPRQRGKVVCPLPEIMLLVLCATLAGTADPRLRAFPECNRLSPSAEATYGSSLSRCRPNLRSCIRPLTCHSDQCSSALIRKRRPQPLRWRYWLQISLCPSHQTKQAGRRPTQEYCMLRESIS